MIFYRKIAKDIIIALLNVENTKSKSMHLKISGCIKCYMEVYRFILSVHK